VDGLGAKTHNSSDFLKLKNKADEAQLKQTLEALPDSHKQDRYLEIGYRPWGVYYVLEDQDLFKVKKIIVQPGARLSLQSHEHRSEHWTVVSGIATVDIRSSEHASIEQLRILKPNESCYIPCGHIHRLINTSTESMVLIEVQCGDYMGEDDIRRFEDDF
jgi:mannose-1-phosphate guanylyltransferase